MALSDIGFRAGVGTVPDGVLVVGRFGGMVGDQFPKLRRDHLCARATAVRWRRTGT